MGRPKGSHNTVAPKVGKKKQKQYPPVRASGAGTGVVMVEGGSPKEMSTALSQALFPGATGDTPAAASLFAAPPEEPKKGKKKEAEPEIDLQTKIMTLTRSINAAYKGRAVLRQGSEIINVFILRRPTGIISLDLALGGGLPAGGLSQIIGKYSSGKSWLANRIMATAQQNYGTQFAAAVNMTEMRYDKAFAKVHCGLRIAYSMEEIELLRQIQASNGLPDLTPEQIAWYQDQVGYFVESVGANAESVLEVAVQQVESNYFQIVMIDSFGALLTKAEAEAEEGLEQKYRGGAAMVVTQFMHRLHAALNLPDAHGRPNTTTVIGINQYRDNVTAGLYGNPMKVAGGNALAHGKLVDLHIEQGAKIRVAVSKTENMIVGKEINWEIMKGKAGCHDGPKGTYKFYLGEAGYPFGADSYSDLLSASLRAGIVQQSGAYYYYQGQSIGQGESAVSQSFYQRPDLMAEIRKEILKASGLSFIVRE